MVITYVIISLALVFFRSPTFDIAISIFSRITTPGGFFIGTPAMLFYSLFGIAVILLRDIVKEYYQKDLFQINSTFFLIRNFPYALLLVITLMIGVFDGGQFIYFKF